MSLSAWIKGLLKVQHIETTNNVTLSKTIGEQQSLPLMTESVYNQFHWIMDNRLTWQDFQVLCHFHLNSIGYSANLGQIPGSDRGHDIYGTGPHGTFIAHSTIQRKGIRTKLRQDITKGVQKCLSLNKPKQEIIFFSRNSVFDDPVEETNYIEEKLVPEL